MAATTPETAPAPLVLTLFGPMRILVAGQPLPRLHSRKGQWLLALLTLRHGRPVAREWLAGMVWPDADQDHAFANLRPVLSDLRRALGAEGTRLQSPDRHSLFLDLSGAEVDVLTFDAAMASKALSDMSRAAAIYTGPLLEGCTEEWVPQERRAREEDCLRALQILADDAIAYGDFGTAADYLRRAVDLDPWREAARRGLMEALARHGDANAALQVYREFTRLLQDDPRAAPDAQTSALYARLRAEMRRQAALPTVAAAAPPTSTIVSHLPQPLTGLIGREDDRQEVASHLRHSRLVTLTGAGGIGKTRLAIDVADEVAQEFSEGVWMVGLETLAADNPVAGQIALVLGMKEEPGRTILQTLTEFLRARRLLLVLDNCEHLLETCAQIVGHLLRECAGVRVLATSREALGLVGETIWPVSALTVPDLQHLPKEPSALLQTLKGYPSLQMFVERAQAVQKTFSLTERNALPVAQVCCRLEGIPLALELAAARVKAMTVAQIEARLDDHLSLLTGGSRGGPTRQQTLRKTLDWSYSLLTQSERIVLARMSIFAGGWDIEAAEHVCADHDLSAKLVMDLLTSLVDKSLVMFEACAAGGRYRLLDTVRQYGAERLAAHEDAAGVRERHRDHFLALAEEAEPHLTGADQGVWLRRLEDERANLRAALDWCGAEKGSAEAGLRLAGALGRFWEMHGYYSEGRRFIAEALQREGADSRTTERSKAQISAGILAFCQGDYRTAKAFYKDSLAISRELKNRQGAAWALHYLGNLAIAQGDMMLARSLQEEGLALFRELGNKQGTAWALHYLGKIALDRADYEAARLLYEEGLVIFRDLGNRQGTAWSLYEMARLAREQGVYERAEMLCGEGLAIFRDLSNRRGAAWSLNELGKVALEQGRPKSAWTLYAEGMSIQRELGDKRGAVIGLRGLAAGLAAQGNVRKAACVWGAAEALCETSGEPLSLHGAVAYNQQVALARAALGEGIFTAAWQEGHALAWEQTTVFALEAAQGMIDWAKRDSYEELF